MNLYTHVNTWTFKIFVPMCTQDKVLNISLAERIKKHLCNELPAAGREKQETDVEVWFIRASVWNETPIRLSASQVTTVFMLPAYTTVRASCSSSPHFLIIFSLISRSRPSWPWTLRQQRPSHHFEVRCFPHFKDFSKRSSSAVGHWTKHQTTWIEPPRAQPSLVIWCLLVCFSRTWTAPLFDLMISVSVSELYWHTATDLTFTQSRMESNETLEYMLLFSPPCEVWSTLCFFLMRAFLCLSVARHFSAPLLSLSFLSDFICCCRPSSQRLSFLHLYHPSSTFFHLLQRFIFLLFCKDKLRFWLLSLNPLTHWVQHACKGWC